MLGAPEMVCWPPSFVEDSDHKAEGRTTVRAAAVTDRDQAGDVSSVRLYQDVSPLVAGEAGPRVGMPVGWVGVART